MSVRLANPISPFTERKPRPTQDQLFLDLFLQASNPLKVHRMKSVRVAPLVWRKVIFYHRLQANPSLSHMNNNHPTRHFSSRLILLLRKGNANFRSEEHTS